MRTDRELVALARPRVRAGRRRASTPTEQWVATAGTDDGTARVWDAATGQELAASTIHPANVVTATFDRGGRLVLTWADDYRARVFRCETCLPLDELVRLARSRLSDRRGQAMRARRGDDPLGAGQAAALRRSRVFAPVAARRSPCSRSPARPSSAGSAPVGAATGTTRGRHRPERIRGHHGRRRRGKPYTCTNELYAGPGCSLSVPTGTALTFRATPKPVRGAPELRPGSEPARPVRISGLEPAGVPGRRGVHGEDGRRRGVGRRTVLAGVARGVVERAGHARRAAACIAPLIGA